VVFGEGWEKSFLGEIGGIQTRPPKAEISPHFYLA